MSITVYHVYHRLYGLTPASCQVALPVLTTSPKPAVAMAVWAFMVFAHYQLMRAALERWGKQRYRPLLATHSPTPPSNHPCILSSRHRLPCLQVGLPVPCTAELGPYWRSLSPHPRLPQAGSLSRLPYPLFYLHVLRLNGVLLSI